MQVNTAEAAIDAAACGVGLVHVLSYQASPAIKAGSLKIVLRKFEAAPLPVSVVYVRDRRASGKLRAFVEFVAPRLRDRIERSGI